MKYITTKFMYNDAAHVKHYNPILYTGNLVEVLAVSYDSIRFVHESGKVTTWRFNERKDRDSEFERLMTAFAKLD